MAYSTGDLGFEFAFILSALQLCYTSSTAKYKRAKGFTVVSIASCQEIMSQVPLSSAHCS
ncbi:hypothetical protein CORC01_06088 [Colletotrichum orchidophilum]|uniref:Uncharacterized protein n=1 Tax=Colletotrichum orchidophilum TaxID=1209926 RepID=A0A1G4BB60_9PEZI|nr:uncharacterized protein CORC01_06088 [Colletotrichum orchidophilum]OHE98637.1 hypothetical protein CORC01_06088 [Colletotrichum orchidophilum]